MQLLLKIGYLILGVFLFTGISAQNTAFVAEDDPIAAALDSLATKKFMENAWSKPQSPKNGKFHFAPDSIPKYEEFIYESRLAKLDASSPFDLQYHKEVKGYIELYANRKRGSVSRMLGLSQMYYPMFEEVLDKYNLPLELKHLAIIESALNPTAKSKAGASGLWQFMYATGKMYGLNVSSYIDERFDPYKETVAAAEYLQFLYNMFGDWQMVLAAYNSGPGTVNHAIRRSGGKKTYWEIRPYLPKETQGYVPAFIAANYIMNYNAEHNIYPAVPKKTYFELDTIIIKEPLTFKQLSEVLEVPVDEIQYFNPIYKKDVIPAGGHILTLPKNYIGKFLNNEEAIYAMIRQREDQKKLVAETSVKEKQIVHVVKKNEKLGTIARKYGVSVADLKSWNFIGKKGIKPGRKLNVYVRDTSPVIVSSDGNVGDEKSNLSSKKENQPKVLAENTKTKKSVYVVRKGDTLFKISQKTGVSVEEIKKENKLTSKSKLSVGQKLKIP